MSLSYVALTRLYFIQTLVCILVTMLAAWRHDTFWTIILGLTTMFSTCCVSYCSYNRGAERERRRR